MALEGCPPCTIHDPVTAGLRPHLPIIEDVRLTPMLSLAPAESPWIEHLQTHLCWRKRGSHKGSCPSGGVGAGREEEEEESWRWRRMTVSRTE